MSLEVIEIAPERDRTPTATLVLLHGWGANARDLASLHPLLNLPDYLCLCPDAPLPHPYVPGGKMWYDLETEEYDGLADSRDRLCQWLDGLEAKTGISLEKTVLAGFSQGGAMTLDVGAHYPLAGLVAMSGYLHGSIEARAKFPPVLVMHGRQDPIVPLSAARQARDRLTEIGATVAYEEFDMAHQICPQEVLKLRQFVLDNTQN
ncbi:alpha/beta hydrolase [Baaleninema sp.]|uniref:alpha/beta hydrolase n=1 Tax=Baaleninema sp. TaxID=3101197 RepID=UPI003D077D17